MQTKILKDLFNTCERLALNEFNWTKKRKKIILSSFLKIEKKGSDIFTRLEKIVLSEDREIEFYRGKITAYIYCIQELSGGKFEISKKYKNFAEWMTKALPDAVACTHLKKTSWNKNDKQFKKTYAKK